MTPHLNRPLHWKELQHIRRWPCGQPPGSASGWMAGQAPILSCSGRAVTLWVAQPSSRAGGAHLGAEAQDSQSRAARRAEIDLPDVASLHLLKPKPQFRMIRILKLGQDRDEPVDGSSAGLSFFLAHTSHMLNRPLPPDVVMSATLEADGTLGQVGGLEQKLALVVYTMPGVCRVWVSEDDVEVACRILSDLGSTITVTGFRRACDILSAAFPEGAAPAEDPDLAAEELFSFCLHGRHCTNWSVIARYAARLKARCHRSAGRHIAGIAEAIATRHAGSKGAGDTGAWPPINGLQRFPRALRLLLFAHRIQEATDRQVAPARLLLRRAGRELPARGEELGEELKLIGAMGLHLSAHGRHKGARRLLHRAVKGWARIREFQEIGRPLCGMLRIAGICMDQHTILKLTLLAEQTLTTNSAPFTCLAMGRAWTQVKNPHEALKWLDDTKKSWNTAPIFVTASRLRWRIMALRLLEQGDEKSRAELQKITSSHPEQAAFAVLLQLDDAIEKESNTNENNTSAGTSGLDSALSACKQHLSVEYSRAQIALPCGTAMEQAMFLSTNSLY